VSNIAAKDWASLFSHWETYALAVSGLIAVFLTQNAYHAGPIAASQSTLVLVDPLASIVIGVGLFGDNLRTSGPWGPLEALSLLVMFAGAVSVAQSPLVSGIMGEGEDSEKLALRSRSQRLNKLLGPETPVSPLPHP
jgi:F0F1-type ATP synthase assembly protein I